MTIELLMYFALLGLVYIQGRTIQSQTNRMNIQMKMFEALEEMVNANHALIVLMDQRKQTHDN
jgi:hypothetical protein